MGHPVGDFPSYCEFDTFFPTKILDIPAPIWISFPNLQITVETAAAAAVPPQSMFLEWLNTTRSLSNT